MANNLNQKLLIKELQKLEDKLVKEFKNLYNQRGTPTGSIKLLNARTDRLLGLQYAIKILNQAIPAIKKGAETGEAYIYMFTPLEISTEFYKTLNSKGY